MTHVDPSLLEIMQCPSCSGGLAEVEKPPSLLCGDCGLRYPVRDGIPVMLIDEAVATGQANSNDQGTTDE